MTDNISFDNKRIEEKLNSLDKTLQLFKRWLSADLEVEANQVTACKGFSLSYERTLNVLFLSTERETGQSLSWRKSIEYGLRYNWLSDGDRWLQMKDDRNSFTHVYNEEHFLNIIPRLKQHFNELQNTAINLTNAHKGN